MNFCEDVLAFAFTPAQRVLARVAFDGVDPERLDAGERDLARLLFGDVDIVPQAARRVIVAVLGRGAGKDEIGAAYLLWRMLVADLPNVGPGDVPAAICIAPDMKLATITKNRAQARAKETEAIARYVENEAADGFTLRRPHDGRLVAFEVLAATRAGSAARGRSVLAALLSECAFFRDESAAVNDLAIYSALLPRLMPGGAILLFSTPWAEAGLFFQLYESDYKRPRVALVAQGSTSLMRGDDEQIAAIIASENERDPLNAARELGAQFIGIGSASFFDAASIDAAVDPDMPHPLPVPDHYVGRSVGVDLGFKLDASAQVISFNERVDGQHVARVAYVDEVLPRAGFPLSPTDIVRRFVAGCKKYGASTFLADAHYELAIREIAAAHGARMHLAPSGNQGKLETYLAAKELFTEHKVKIPKHPRLIQQLKAVISRPRPGGLVRIEVPRRVGQSHGDIASACVLSLYWVRQANAGEPRRRALAQKAERMQFVGAIMTGSVPVGQAERFFALASGRSPDELEESIYAQLARARPRDANGSLRTGLSEDDAAAWGRKLQGSPSPAASTKGDER